MFLFEDGLIEKLVGVATENLAYARSTSQPVMVITQRVLLDAPVDSWSRNFCVSLYYPDRDEPVHVYGADSESVATAFLGDHPTCKVLFKSKDHYDYFSRALQHDDLCADHSGADCDKYEPDLEQLLWYDMEFSLNKRDPLVSLID